VLDKRGQLLRASAFVTRLLMRLIGFALTLTLAPFAVEAQQGREDAPGTVLEGTARELNWFATHCVALADMYVVATKRICRVNSFRPLGAMSGRELHFALYRRLVILPGDNIASGSDHLQGGATVDKPPFRNTAVVIFEGTGEPGKARPILASVNEGYLGNEWFGEPRIIERDGKQLLVIAREIYRAPAEEQYYVFEKGAWALVERPK
jgi:hypothetical protein